MANNFDLIRIMAALAVLFWHAHVLTGRADKEILVRLSGGQLHFGDVGVAAFFLSSGFLLFMSWGRDPNPVRFVLNRILRIIPALAAIVLLTVFVIGPAISSHAPAEYFSFASTYTYLLNIKLFPLQHDLPGCFTHNPYPNAVNGSLWTIPYEVLCYLVFVLLSAIGILKGRYSALALWLITAFVYLGIIQSGHSDDLPSHFLGLAVPDLLCFSGFFWAGAFFSQYQSRIPVSLPLSALALVCMAVSSRYGFLKECFLFFFSYLVFAAAHMRMPESLRKGVTRFGDLSYGLYLSGCPTQQILVQFVPGGRLPLINFLVAAVVGSAYAACSWRFIESRALRLKGGLLVRLRWIEWFSRNEAITTGSQIFRVATALALGGIPLAIIGRPTPLPPAGLYGNRAFDGQLGDQWLPYNPAEGHRWMGRTASVMLRKGLETTALHIKMYVPGNFREVTHVTILIDEKVVHEADGNADGGGWLIDEKVAVPKVYRSRSSRITLVINGVHKLKATDPDQRVVAALVEVIAFE